MSSRLATRACSFRRGCLVSPPSRTCLHQVLHGGESLVDGRADRAVNEHTRQVGISHECPACQPGSFISPTNMSTHQSCQAVRPGDILKLAPPTGHDQGHIETWFNKINKNQTCGVVGRHCFQEYRFMTEYHIGFSDLSGFNELMVQFN